MRLVCNTFDVEPATIGVVEIPALPSDLLNSSRGSRSERRYCEQCRDAVWPGHLCEGRTKESGEMAKGRVQGAALS